MDKCVDGSTFREVHNCFQDFLTHSWEADRWLNIFPYTFFLKCIGKTLVNGQIIIWWSGNGHEPSLKLERRCVDRWSCSRWFISIERTPPPRGGFLFTMFPDQEAGGTPPEACFRGGPFPPGSWSGNMVHRKPPPGGGLSINLRIVRDSVQIDQLERRRADASTYTHWRADGSTQALYVRKRALFIRRRTLYICQKALYIYERALYIRERALYICKRALNIRRRGVSTCTHPWINLHTFYQTNKQTNKNPLHAVHADTHCGCTFV